MNGSIGFSYEPNPSRKINPEEAFRFFFFTFFIYRVLCLEIKMQKDMNIYSYSCVTSQLRNSAFPVSDSRYQTKCA
jgi:hypothetical protein